MSKKINVRTQHKIDTYENWSKAENFVPLKGELIIYTTDENGNEIVKLKIGDGETVVHSLPFAVGGSATDEPGLAQIQSDWAQTDETQPDYIKNKIGHTITSTVDYDTFDLGAADDGNELDGVYATMYTRSNPLTANTANVSLRNKTTEEIVDFGICEVSTFNLDGMDCFEILINTTTTFMDFVMAEGNIPFAKIDSSSPSMVIMGAEAASMTQIVCDMADYINYELIIKEEKENVIGLPDNILSEEFQNINGKLSLALGKTITVEKEINNSYTTTLGTPNSTTPFLIWNNVVKDEQIYDNIQDGTLVKVSYIENDETIEIGTYNLFSNSTLDTQFGMGSNNTGYYGLINAAQSLEEVLEGNWTRADLNKPTFTLVFAKSNTSGQSWLQIAAPESLTEITFIVEINTTETESRTIKLTNEAINIDEVPTEGSTNFLTSGAIKSALSSIDVELPQNVSYFTNDANYQSWEQVNESINIKANEIEGKIPIVPTNVSSFINDAGYLTEHQNLDAYALKTEIPIIPSDVSTFNNDANYQTDVDVSNTIDNVIGNVDVAIAQLEAMIGGASS